MDGTSCTGPACPSTDAAAKTDEGAKKFREFMMVGVKVSFPVKPYSSQMAVMAQILRGLQKEQNCLLESPTGTGKSLALLCSTLAWQRQHNERVGRYNNLIDQDITDPETLSRLSGLRVNPTQPRPADTPMPVPKPRVPAMGQRAGGRAVPSGSVMPSGATTGTVAPTCTAAPSTCPVPCSDAGTLSGATAAGDTGHTTAPIDTTAPSGSGCQATAEGGKCADGRYDADTAATKQEGSQRPGGFLRGDDNNSEDLDAFVTPPGVLKGFNVLDDTSDPRLNGGPQYDAAVRPTKMRTSKIFFGSRTHKQLSQVIRELKRTAYADVRTVVLGSRDHYCIHPIVSTKPNKTELCQQLRDPRTPDICSYYQNASRVKTHSSMETVLGIHGAHDLEELVIAGKRSRCCPYYVAKNAVDTADIVFCPYNYLVDPLIRDAMKLSLKHNVVVLDEAHNIEDCSREAASCSINIRDVNDAKSDIEKVKKYCSKQDACNSLIMFLSILSNWIAKSADHLTESFESSKNSQICTGSEMIAILDNLEIGRAQWTVLRTSLAELTEQPPDDESSDRTPKAVTTMLLKNIFLMYHFLFGRPLADADDYRVAVVKCQTKRPAPEQTVGVWLKRRPPKAQWTVYLNFICLNPGVAFQEVGKAARNVILTSGTLSPMASFQSELAVPFPIQLEANHVIDKKQVWVGTVSMGPNNVPLQATFKFTDTPQFQDELGSLLLAVCRAVPRGVLCFLPSYTLLDKLKSRWEYSGLWNALSQIKMVLVESRGSEMFEQTIESYYETIRCTSDPELCSEGVNGALLIAVCRGKVSEGLDFTDDNARAVVAVGIPFPNIKDTQLSLKRQYNNLHCQARGLLSGSAWYEIQAYRALNQALGRCIRHRYDWGALLLVDERYQAGGFRPTQQHNKYISGLSKWIRAVITHYPTFQSALYDMTVFVDNMTQNPPVRPEPIEPKIVSAPPPKELAPVFMHCKTPTTVSREHAGTVREPRTSRERVTTSRGLPPITSTQATQAAATATQIIDLTALSQIPAAVLTDDSFCGASSVMSVELDTLSDETKNDVNLSSPATRLTEMVSLKLRTASPNTSIDARKRKIEISPLRPPSLKKECITPCSSILNSFSAHRFKFMSSETIKKLSPKKSYTQNTFNFTPVRLNSSQSAEHQTETFSDANKPKTRPASPDLFTEDEDDDVIFVSASDQQHPADAASSSTGAGMAEDAIRPEDVMEDAAGPRRPVPLTARPVFAPPVRDSDSDMDDFDLDKSVRRSPEIKRRVSHRSRKGVVFSKFCN